MNTPLKTMVLSAVVVLALVASLWAKGNAPKPKVLDVPAVVDARIQSLSDHDVTVRCCGATALGVIGPAAIKSVPALLQALCDVNPRVCAAAALALKKIDPATFGMD